MRALLISTYDLGHQPLGLASAAAVLRETGMDVQCADLSRDRLADDEVRAAGLIAFFLPMHTAARLAVPVVKRVRVLNPGARLCAYGLYAPLNEALLHELGVTLVIGGEFEDDLRRIGLGQAPLSGGVPRVTFPVPLRAALPPLTRYARLRLDGESRIAGYTEASRGCKHHCRHCPIVPVYQGRFRVIPADVVLADVRTQVDMGARHITFGDPDFFNGIRHAEAIVRAFAAEFPGISYDVTIKVEHLRKHAEALPLLRDTGCLIVTTAVESVDDDVLARLKKGHTREDFERVVDHCRSIGLTLAPTFVAFTPWTTLERYRELLQTIDRLDLVEHVAPIQLALRLLVTEGSGLLDLSDVRRLAGPYDPKTLTYPWRHPDPRVDALQEQVLSLAGADLTSTRPETFARVWNAADAAAGGPSPMRPKNLLPRAAVPYLNEPWYC